MIIDTLTALIILLNGAVVPIDSIRTLTTPQVDTVIYAIIEGDTIWTTREQTIDERDAELQKIFNGVGIDDFEQVIIDIDELKRDTDRLNDIVSKRKRPTGRVEINRERKVIDKEMFSRLFSVHPDTIAIWTQKHKIEKHSKQYREFNLK